ncbi:hypothetical protein ACFX2H_029807 [Malus domestica]
MYMHLKSCIRSYTNASITLLPKDEFKSNPVTRAYISWWLKQAHFDYASATPLQDGLMALTSQLPCLSSQHLDVSEEASDKVDSHEDELILWQRKQVLNKQPHEGALDDNDVNFRHKKKKMLSLPEFDSANIGIHSYMDMLFGSNLPTYEEIGDLSIAKLVPNPPICQSLLCVSEGMLELVMHPKPLPTSFEISMRGPNLSGTKQFIHRIKLRAAIDLKSHIEKRILKCPFDDLAFLKEDLSKLVSVIDNLNIDSSLLRIKIAKFMATSTECSSLHVISLKKLSIEIRAQQLTAIDLSIAQVRSSQQVALEGYQAIETSLASVKVRLEALVRK